MSFLELACLRGHSGAVQCAVFNASGSHCLSGGTDRVVNLWNPYRPPFEEDAATGALVVQQYRGHGHDVTGIAVAGDGALFASVGGDRCAFVWDTERGEATRRVYGHDSRVSAVALGGDGGAAASVLATGGDDMTLRLHDLRAPATRGPLQTLKGFRDKVTGVAVVEGCILATCLDGALRAWDLRAGRATTDVLPAGPGAAAGGAPAPLTALAPPTPSSALVASTRAGGTLALLDRPSGAVLATMVGHTCRNYRCVPALLPGGTGVVCGGEGGELLFWDALAPPGAAPVPLPAVHRGPVAHVHSVALEGTGETVVLSAGHDGTVRLWEKRGGGSGSASGASLHQGDVALQRSLGAPTHRH
jgi:mitogen-activated protein kinase organizer 1